jgi:hypothetical protein
VHQLLTQLAGTNSRVGYSCPYAQARPCVSCVCSRLQDLQFDCVGFLQLLLPLHKLHCFIMKLVRPVQNRLHNIFLVHCVMAACAQAVVLPLLIHWL